MMKSLAAPSLALAVVAFTACGGTTAGTSAPAAVAPATTLTVPQNYTLVWADEFSGEGVPDPASWVHETARNKEGWYNNEKQYYSAPRPENAKVSGGVLTITARKEARRDQADWGGQNYSSARLATIGKKEWTYGFFEIRAKLSCGKGAWPAIWMLGSKGEWPAVGELDIMEWIGHRPDRVFSTVHTAAGSGGNGKGADTAISNACTTFHNYQMHWTPQSVQFAVDGKIHFTYANPGTGVAAWPFDAPQFMILNIAIGGDLGGAVDDGMFPTQMVVDYVRVYQKTK